ncbi:hypothetical protein E2562_023349 [Oryza meyeriana var. granulata]|uniref:non-specific serine/threonine protein kinase n=1 Tax=Oryza meyeriana var. granulata TaxID=110450 RepID=A0A6G1E0P6_9ORYZ|nr:hypothetical protein E2562_023349 [Oryza meyeriana var. granulata]
MGLNTVHFLSLHLGAIATTMAMARASLPLLPLFISVVLQFKAAGADGEDAAALLAFKAAAVGVGGGNGVLASWNGSAAGMCSWEGVTCGRHRRAVELSLPGHDLSGTLSPAVGNLTSLRMLDLSYNWLHGGIPGSLGRLRRLRALDLGFNTFSGEVPGNLTSCTSLEYLALGSNKLTGRIPAELGNTLTRLQQLGLDNNSFIGHWPASLSNLSSLEYLSLRMNSLEGTIPPSFGSDMPLLHFIDICSNNLSGALPSSLYNLSSLMGFDAGNNKLNGSIAADIGEKFLHLQDFAVFNNQFSGEIPSSFSNLTNLSSLQLSMNGFSGFVPRDLGRLNGLQNLQLGVNMLEAGDIKGWEFVDSLANCKSIGKLSNLTGLYLYNNSLSGHVPSSFGNLTKLIKLFMQGNKLEGPIPVNLDRKKGQSLTNVWIYKKFCGRMLDIAVDIMDALEYLHNHCQPPIVHCDLKPSNILLAEDMSARVGDFGISRILTESASKSLQNSSITIGVRGSIGYVAPEYGEGSAVSTLGDVYSLGILLLEMFTGMSPTDDMFRDSLDLHSFAEAAHPDRILEIADPTLLVHADAKDSITRSRMQECLISVIGLGLSCSKHQPKERILIQDAAVKMHAIRDDAYQMFSGSLSVDMGEDTKQICSDLK